MTTLQHAGRIGIRIYGTPIPQGSKVANHFGHGVRDANAAKLKPWRKTVRAQAEDVTRHHDTLTGPVRVWVRFTFTRPASHYRTGRNAHLVRDTAPLYPGVKHGDIDKLVRAIFDALTDAGVWSDDTQVVDVRARKFYAGEDELALDKPGVDVVVEPIEADVPLTTVPVSEGEAGAGTVHDQGALL
jgi:Holliday junction resolvase RusA-like endonuclease